MPHTTLDLFREIVDEFITEDRKDWLRIEPNGLKHREVRQRLEVFQQLRTRVMEIFTEEQLEEDSVYQAWSPIEDQWEEYLTNLINRLYRLLDDKVAFQRKGAENQATLLKQYCEYWWIYRTEFSSEAKQEEFINKDSVLSKYRKTRIQDHYLETSQAILKDLITLEVKNPEDHRTILTRKREFDACLDRLHQLPILFKTPNDSKRTQLIEGLRIKSDNPLHAKIKKSEDFVAQKDLEAIRKELEEAKAQEEEARKKAAAIEKRKTVKFRLQTRKQRRRGSVAASEAASAAREKLLTQEEQQQREEEQRLQKQQELELAQQAEATAKAVAEDLQAKLDVFYLDATLKPIANERREAYEVLIYMLGQQDASTLPDILKSAKERWKLVPNIKKELRCVKLTGKNWGDFSQLCKLAEKRIARDQEEAKRILQEGESANAKELQQQIEQRNQQRLNEANQLTQSLARLRKSRFASWAVTISCGGAALGTSTALFAATDWVIINNQLTLTNTQIGLIVGIGFFMVLALVMALVAIKKHTRIKQKEQKISELKTPLTLESLKADQEQSERNWKADRAAIERRSILLGHQRDPQKIEQEKKAREEQRQLLEAARLV